MDFVPFTIFLQLQAFCLVWPLMNEATGAEEGQDLTTKVSVKNGVASVSELTWNLPRPVLPYQSYMDVYPTRYDIPTGLSGVTWAFQLLSSVRNCGNFSVHFLLQQGGLPLVNQSSQSFPDNYYVPVSTSSLIHFELGHGHMGRFYWLHPTPGPWYVIAYTNEAVDGRIRQKGLHKETNKCMVNYMSTLQLGQPLQRRLLSLGELHTVNVTKDGTLIGFSLPVSAFGFRITFSNCKAQNCSFTLRLEPFNLRKELFKECFNVGATPCHFRVPSPKLGDEQTVVLSATSHDSLDVQIKISHLSCKNFMAFSRTSCVTLFPLTRINTISPGFTNMGNVYLTPMSPHITFGWTRINVIPFRIQEPNDIGLTLTWQMHISSFGNEQYMLEKDLAVHVCGGLIYNHLPDLQDETFDVCLNMTRPAHVSMISGGSRNESTIHVPYPRVGIWHIVLQATCYLVESGSEVTCPLETSVDMSVRLNRCIRNECGGRGDCLFRTIGSELVTYSACKCHADYRGYGCQDDSEALSSSIQLAGAFLLTMSNFLFLPAIAIAAKRRFYLEAFAYSYTMAFSAFYHACDGDRIDQYRLCIIPFSILQSADFFGSSCSVWITLIAMAAIRIRFLTPLLQVMGPFGLFIGVVYDKTSLWVIATPIAAGLLVLVISWGIKMYTRKKLFPSKRRYLFFLLPGVTLATTAAVIYSYLETQNNYKYLHSMWHACIALSICFLLPPRNGPDDSKDKGTVTTRLTHMTVMNHSGSNGHVSQGENVSDSNVDEKEHDDDSGNMTCTDVTDPLGH